MSLPPAIRLASPPAKLLSHARSLLPPYSQIQLSKHLHISLSHAHTHTSTTALYWLVHHTPAQSTAGTRKPKGPVTSLSDQVSLVTAAQCREHVSACACTHTHTRAWGADTNTDGCMWVTMTYPVCNTGPSRHMGTHPNT